MQQCGNIPNQIPFLYPVLPTIVMDFRYPFSLIFVQNVKSVASAPRDPYVLGDGPWWFRKAVFQLTYCHFNVSFLNFFKTLATDGCKNVPITSSQSVYPSVRCKDSRTADCWGSFSKIRGRIPTLFAIDRRITVADFYEDWHVFLCMIGWGIHSQSHNHVGNLLWWRHLPAGQAPDIQPTSLTPENFHVTGGCQRRSNLKFWLKCQNC